MRIAAFPPLLLCTLIAHGTSAADELEGHDQPRPLTAPIINGSPASDIPEHRAVVALHVISRPLNQVSSPFCTGTLISDTVVLTAAHCLEENPATGQPFRPEELAIYIGNDPSVDLAQNLYLVSDMAIHPEYDSGDGVRVPVNDIAVAVLEDPAPIVPIPPLPRIIGFTVADMGARLNFAGFGLDENQESGRKLQTDGVLGGLGCAVNGCGAIGPQAALVEATQVSYAMEQSGPCFGDSGGPAFLYRGTRPYVGGVTSYGDQSCTVYGASTRVDAYMPWLQQYIGVDAAPPAVTIVSPSADDIVATGFVVEAAASDDEGVIRMDLSIDGLLVQSLVAEPWVFDIAPGLATGIHTIRVTAYDSANSTSATVTVTAEEPAAGGCSATGARRGLPAFACLLLALLLALRPRRIRTRA